MTNWINLFLLGRNCVNKHNMLENNPHITHYNCNGFEEDIHIHIYIYTAHLAGTNILINSYTHINIYI